VRGSSLLYEKHSGADGARYVAGRGTPLVASAPQRNVFRLDARPTRFRMPDEEIKPPIAADAAGA
jgi:hypothetical protein